MLKMVQNCILVQLPEKKEKSEGGIYLVPNSDKFHEGTIVAAGPGKRNKKGEVVPVEVKVGDTILFEPGKGMALEMDGKKFMVMREPDVAVVTDRIYGNLYDTASHYSQPEIRV